jgi:hypothetical protein
MISKDAIPYISCTNYTRSHIDYPFLAGREKKAVKQFACSYAAGETFYVIARAAVFRPTLAPPARAGEQSPVISILTVRGDCFGSRYEREGRPLYSTLAMTWILWGKLRYLPINYYPGASFEKKTRFIFVKLR